MVSASTDKAEGALKGLGGTISGLGGFAAKAGLAVGGGLLVAGVGAAAAALKIGGEFDGAYDSIAATTGKSGKELDALKASFKNVVSGVPADFDTASGAVATFSQKLGFTGSDLEDVTKQALNLSRATGTDVTGNVEAAAGASKKWGLDAGLSSSLMDDLFGAEKEAGVGFAPLADQVTQFQPQLQAMGLDASRGAGLLGNLGAAGIDASAVMPGLTKALGAMVKDGIDPAMGINKLFETVKKEGPNSATAMETFGKSGLSLAAAISSGALSFDDFGVAMKDNVGLIDSTAAATDDFGQKLDTFKNQVKVAMEPAGAAIFDALGAAMTWLEPYMPMIGQLISDVIARVMEVTGKLKAWWDTNWPAIHATIKTVVDWIVANVPPFISGVVDTVMTVIGNLKAFWDENWPAIHATIQTVWEWINENIPPFIQAVYDVIHGVMVTLKTFWDEHWDGISAYLGLIWAGIQVIVQTAVDLVQSTIKIATDLLTGDWDAAWEEIKGILFRLWDRITAEIGPAVAAVWTAITGKIDEWKTSIATKMGEVKQWFIDEAGKFADAGIKIVEGLWAGINDSAQWIIDKIGGWVGSIVAAAKRFLGIGSPSKVFAKMGGQLVDGLRAGWGAAFPGLIGRVIGDMKRLTDMVGKKAGGMIRGFPTMGGGGGVARGTASGSAWGQSGQLRAHLGAPISGMGGIQSVGRNIGSMNIGGRGGFRAASGANYWKNWTAKNGIPDEAWARAMSKQLGLQIPQWLEDAWKGSLVANPKEGAIGKAIGMQPAFPPPFTPGPGAPTPGRGPGPPQVSPAPGRGGYTPFPPPIIRPGGVFDLLGWDKDKGCIVTPDGVLAPLQAMLGAGLEWSKDRICGDVIDGWSKEKICIVTPSGIIAKAETVLGMLKGGKGDPVQATIDGWSKDRICAVGKDGTVVGPAAALLEALGISAGNASYGGLTAEMSVNVRP